MEQKKMYTEAELVREKIKMFEAHELVIQREHYKTFAIVYYVVAVAIITLICYAGDRFGKIAWSVIGGIAGYEILTLPWMIALTIKLIKNKPKSILWLD